jgi:protein SCO1/2
MIKRRASHMLSAVLLAAGVCLLLAAGLQAQEYANDDTVGIEPRLGETVPLDLTFNNEQGEPVDLRSVIQRPTVLLLVYFRCPSICSPVMHEVADTVEKMQLTPGVDYDLLTISFDSEETPELARIAKENLLADMDQKIPPDSWHFLTGDKKNIARLTDSVGFRFRRDDKDFEHAGTVIFLSPDGKIVRYLPGMKLLPDHMVMAIQDAADGRARSFMQKIQRLCYSYDPEGKTYVMKVNRIILAVTFFVLGLFLIYLLLFSGGKKMADVNEIGEVRMADGD